MGQGRQFAQGVVIRQVTLWAPGACSHWGLGWGEAGGCGSHTSEWLCLKDVGARVFKHQLYSVIGKPAEWGGGMRSLALA